jgi:hypothetical protein
LRKEEKRWSLEWDGQCIWSRGTNKSRGVAVLFNRNLVFNFQNVLCDHHGRYISFDLYMNEHKYRLMNVYSPNEGTDRLSFFEMIQTFCVDEYENIIAGDFNCALNGVLDRQNCIGSHDIGQIEIKNLMGKFDFINIWRMFGGEDTQRFENFLGRKLV